MCSYDGYYRESPAQKPGFNAFHYETGQGQAADAVANHRARHPFPGVGVIDPALSQATPPDSGGGGSGADVESLKRKIQMLEDLVMTSSRPSVSGDRPSSSAQSHSPAVVTTTGMGEMVYDGLEEERGVTRSFAYKKRLFGQSHLMHATTMVRPS